MDTEVLVVIGVGGIGQAIARRQGCGKLVLLADFNEDTLEAAATRLETTGYRVATERVDVSSRESVRSLAAAASKLGNVLQVVNTVGLSPNMASPERILAVDLLGVALVFEELAG
jgi:NAD(P)-dependent dehydrogenase (short-subunit alcohol dehydrogenase family)